MKGKVLVTDNYDSFTFNLAQMLLKLGVKVRVFRNDEVKSPCVLFGPKRKNLIENFLRVSCEGSKKKGAC